MIAQTGDDYAAAGELASIRSLKGRTKNEPRLAVPSCHGRLAIINTI